MWSRIGDINEVSNTGNLSAMVSYPAYHIACPISYFSINLYRDGNVTLFIYLAYLPGLEGVMKLLADKKGGVFESPSVFGASFHQCRIKQEDIDWFIKLMHFINLKFNHGFFDGAIIAEVTKLFNWLQNRTTVLYEHLISETANTTKAYLNPALLESTDLLKLAQGFVFENQVETSAKILNCLSAGEDPHQTDVYHNNPLDTLINHTMNLRGRLTIAKMKQLESFLMALTIEFLCYGLDPIRRNKPCRISTFELIVSSSFWSVYDVIVKSMSKPPRLSLKLEQKPMHYIKNDRIYTEIPIPGKNIRTCLMPTHYLNQAEVIALFAVFVKLFDHVNPNDDDKKRLLIAFCEILAERDKMIEVFYHDNRIIGFNLTYLFFDHERKLITYRGDYFLVEREYQRDGLVPLTYAQWACAVAIYFGNTTEFEKYDVEFNCETGTPKGYGLFQNTLHYPKYQTAERSQYAKEFMTYKIFGGVCVYVHGNGNNQNFPCYVKDSIMAKPASAESETKFNKFEYLFKHVLQGVPETLINQLIALDRATPIFICVAEDYRQLWCEGAKRMGIEDPDAYLLQCAKLLDKTSWFHLLQNSTLARKPNAFHMRVFHLDAFKFFLKKRILAPLNGRPIMPGCSSG